MPPDEQRIAIAEACGWKMILGGIPILRWQKDERGYMQQATRDDLPDYLSDLNAMHEAEKVLTKNQRRRYVQVLDRMFDDEDCIDWPLITATAAQRAETFLKTLNLWKPDR